MRELVWTGFITVDGVVDSPGGVEEGHPGGGWVFRTNLVPETFDLKVAELEETSALMFGKRSFESFRDFWPTSADHADYNPLPKYVVSSTLSESALHPQWGEQTILRTTADVAELKKTDGGAIFIHGSAELARRLADEGLIDRYNLLVFPALVGGGKGVFAEQPHPERRLVLRESEAYSNGVLKLIYEVVR
ncbi:dihydrofolate reductase family protein [Microbacterium sp. CCNWLW134]|uniref:dihydrofolate reductase family protein n=1 Tax=Microbacterium sp. CCNWLW134 TaxID=3122064 RepID=UPI00300FA62E